MNLNWNEVTETIYFFDCDQEEILAAHNSWSQDLVFGTKTKTQIVSGINIPKFMFGLEMPQADERLYLLVSTKSKWTACFDKKQDINSLPYVLSKYAKCKAVLICVDPDTEREHRKDSSVELKYGCVRLSYIDSGELVRGIGVYNEGVNGRWSLETYGDPLPFEREDLYQKRLIRHRFTPEALDEVLKKNFGIDYTNPDFYLTNEKCMLIRRIPKFLGIF